MQFYSGLGEPVSPPPPPPFPTEKYYQVCCGDPPPSTPRCSQCDPYLMRQHLSSHWEVLTKSAVVTTPDTSAKLQIQQQKSYLLLQSTEPKKTKLNGSPRSAMLSTYNYITVEICFQNSCPYWSVLDKTTEYPLKPVNARHAGAICHTSALWQQLEKLSGTDQGIGTM